MEGIQLLLQSVQSYTVYIILTLCLLVLCLCVWLVNLQLKFSRLNRRYQRMMQGMDGASLERVMFSRLEDLQLALVAVDKIKQANQQLETTLQSCIQRVGIVRFNAFDDTGSDLSFSLALLDGNNNGVVMSNIYGRNESRLYAKPITQLQSAYTLSTEEVQAVELATNPTVS